MLIYGLLGIEIKGEYGIRVEACKKRLLRKLVEERRAVSVFSHSGVGVFQYTASMAHPSHSILLKYNNLITQLKLLTHRYKTCTLLPNTNHTHHTRFNQLHIAAICILSHQLRTIPLAHTFTSTHSMYCKNHCYAGSSHAVLSCNHLLQDYLATTITIGYLQETSSGNTMFWNL